MRILVTGHVGFIGSHFVKHLLETTNHDVIGFSRYSDQGNLRRLNGLLRNQDFSRLRNVWGDLIDTQAMSGVCEGIDVVVNFAAKTFVDHSLTDRKPFLESNIIGADNLMEEATRYKVKKFIQISTDEVYGQILVGSYKESAQLQPRNPYSWSKACSDLNALQRHRTYQFPAIVTRTENNFGPWQHRQKVLPTFVRHALADDPLPIYGDGQHVRCWLHVNEHCRAIHHLMDHGKVGEIYHVAGESEMTNLELANLVLTTLNKPIDMFRSIPDHNIRPGHDRRYALDCAKLRGSGFHIKQDLTKLLTETIRWYAEHPEWTR
jgi:dTDP-glucose 4,6-dehydratase